jgi:chromate transporter
VGPGSAIHLGSALYGGVSPPLTMGLVIAGGYVMARAAAGWQSVAVTAAAVELVLGTRMNPLCILMAGGALGASGAL